MIIILMNHGVWKAKVNNNKKNKNRKESQNKIPF